MTTYRFFKEVCGFNDEKLLDTLVRLAKERRFQKGEYIVRMGECEPYIFFTVRGVMRGFVIDEDGNEFTECLAYEPGFIPKGTNEVRPDVPSPISIQVLKDDSLYYCVPVEDIANVIKTYPPAYEYYSRQLIGQFEEHRELKAVLHERNAVDRYKWFLQKYPGLFDLVENQYIASFLNMDPATLSRVRRTVQEQ